MTEQTLVKSRGVWGLPRCCAFLTLALVAAFPPVAWWGFGNFGNTGLLAAFVAALTCWIGGTIALVFTALSVRRSTGAVSSLLFGMLFRMGLPLVVGMSLDRTGGPLASAGVFGMVLIFYLLTLAVETPLSLKIVHKPQRFSQAT